MGSIRPHELSLNCMPTFIPRTVSEFLGQVSMIENVKERLLKIDEYVGRLEDEMRKIDAFKSALPLSMLLLKDAIGAVKEEEIQCRKLIQEPVLEEFIPLKSSYSKDDNKVEVRKGRDNKERRNWLSSMQLWNGDQHCPNLNLSSANSSKPEIIKTAKQEANKVVSNHPFKSFDCLPVGTAFVPFKGNAGFPLTAARKEEREKLAAAPGLSLQTPGSKTASDDIVSFGLSSKISGSRIRSSSPSNGQSSFFNGSQPQQQQMTRKQRRCWSPELHRRFVEALQQLGGSQVATPKQIRELMQVDGLTNDEVKSHLQKYRLHTRRLSTASAANTDKSGLGLWTPQDQSSDSSKQSNSLSGSPQDPLQFGGASRATSMTGGDSMDDEDDNKSESHSWRSHVKSSEKSDV